MRTHVLRVVQLVLALCCSTSAWNETLELIDPSRTSVLHPHGRTVKAIVCGSDAGKKDGTDPLYVFGHGFDCLAADYGEY